MRFAGIDCPGCANHNGSSAQTHSANFRAAAITMRFRTSENPCCGNHNGSSAQRHVANIRAAAITMRFRTSENPCCANHDGSSAQSQWQPAPSGGSGYCACHAEGSQRHQRRQRAPQPLLEALDTAPATRKTGSGTSGDNARHSPFWRLWVLRLPRGRQQAAPAATTRAAAPLECACHEDSQRHQRRQRAPQPLLVRLPRGRQPAAPAATTRATAPSGGSGYCACHEDSQRHQWRQRAPQPLLEALGTAPATKTASGTSGDNARRNPFWRLWVLRLPRRQQAAPAATTRAAAPSGGSGYCACHDLLLYSGIFVFFFCCF